MHYLPGRVTIGLIIGDGRAALIRHTESDPFFLFGAAPFKAVRSKWSHSAHVREGRATFEIQDPRPIWRRMG